MVQRNPAPRLFVSALAVVLPLSVALSLGGCAQLLRGSPGQKVETNSASSEAKIVYRQTVPSAKRKVRSKSYRLGEPYRVGRGEPMVSIKNYTVAERVVRAVALEDFAQICGGGALSAAKTCSDVPLQYVQGGLGDTFDIIGTTDLNGVTFFMVALPGAEGRAYLLVDSNGHLARDRYVAWRAKDDDRFHVRGNPHDLIATAPRIETAGPLFSLESDEAFVNTGSRYLNYDLVYNGITQTTRGPVFHMLYREYQRDATQVPIYQQDLAYAVGEREIDVLGLRMTVGAVDAQGISFSVVQESATDR